MRLLLLLFLMACACNEVPIWNGKVYVALNKDEDGQPIEPVIARKQSEEYIYPLDEAFHTMKCMSDEDFRSFVETYVNGCQKWEKGTKLNYSFWKKLKPLRGE